MVKRLFYLYFFWPIGLWAQPGAVISLQPERIEMGDTAVLLVFVNGSNAEPGDVDFFPWSDQIPAQNIVRRSPWKRSGAQWMRRFTIIAFDSASLKLPPLKVKLPSGTVLETNSTQLLVFPTPGGSDISDMAKIRDIRRESESWVDYWLYGAGGLALLLSAIWWWWKNRRKPAPAPIVVQTPAPAPIAISATEKALAQLQALRQKQYWKHNQVKEHYVEFSFIVREFLENQFNIPALESTTLELTALLQKKEAPKVLQTQVEQLLQQADLVKYAQKQPAQDIHESVLEKAQILIHSYHSGPPPKTPVATNMNANPQSPPDRLL
ncbi:MAG: hypothetical protein J0M29_04525 [Chitinophagales bacterium]|nr:hypothetical protein [Chitinophagales bacterium]